MADIPRYLIKVEGMATNGYEYIITLLDIHKGRSLLYLTTLDWTKFKDEDFICITDAIDSDGCTGVPDFYLGGCIIHDYHYRTHRDFNGASMTRAEADARLRKYIQTRSLYGVFSPMSWWRWAALRLVGSKSWNRKEW